MTDEKFETQIREAFDAVGPTAEQEERMLASLLKAQEAAENGQRSVADQAAEDQDAKTSESTTAAAPAKRKQGFKVWKVALPLAACLAVGAVVIGIAGNAPEEPSNLMVEVEAQSAAAPAGGAEETSEELEALVTDDAVADGMPYATSGAIAVKAESAADESGFYDGLPNEFNTEEYAALAETGFVSTRSNPLSTVSADVDTASYCNVRRMINDGYKLSDVPSGSVRIEEMLNYFDYDYAAPTGGDLFNIQAQSATCPWNQDTQLLVLGFSASPENQAASKGSNLVFLVDVSGSMDSPDKLDLLQDSFATLLENLGPHDRVSIVTYASGEEIVLEGAAGDDQKSILRAIYKLRADGSTNGEAGLQQAYEVAQRNYIEGGVNRIIMASDGDLNVGVTSESDLYDLVDGKRETGIYLSVLGFGSGNYKDNKMETLADHGNGSYHYIDCVEEAERVLKEKLTANLVPFADDVKVQVEFNPSQVKAYRLIGYENRELADNDFRNDEVDAGDVGPGSQFTVAYEVVLADSKFEIDEPNLKYGASQSSYDAASSDWLTCTMRYHEFDGDKMTEQQLVVGAADATAQPSSDWKLAASVIEFGMLARNSHYAGTSSLDQIRSLLAGAEGDAQASSFLELAEKALR